MVVKKSMTDSYTRKVIADPGATRSALGMHPRKKPANPSRFHIRRTLFTTPRYCLLTARTSPSGVISMESARCCSLAFNTCNGYVTVLAILDARQEHKKVSYVSFRNSLYNIKTWPTYIFETAPIVKKPSESSKRSRTGLLSSRFGRTI